MSEIKRLETEWILSVVLSTILKTVAAVHLSVYVMQRIQSEHTAMSEIACCATGVLCSKILEMKGVQDWLIANAKKMFVLLWLLDSVIEFYAIGNPVFYVIVGYAAFTVTNELVCFMFRWYKNRMWEDPDDRTQFEGRVSTWVWASKFVGGALGLLTIDNINIAVSIGIVGFSVSTIGMCANIHRTRNLIANRT